MFYELSAKVDLKDCKKEWNHFEHIGILEVLKNGFKKYGINNIEDHFGLPYTSTSQCAMIGNTNTYFHLNNDMKYNLEYFVLTNNNILVAVFWDVDENEKFYRVEVEEE